jgi:negative regulator of sigma E activity
MTCGRPIARTLSRAALAATLALCVSGSALAAIAPAAPPEDPEALLRESLLAPLTVSYVGQIETVRFSLNRATATIVKIEHRAPQMTRRWYVAPEALYGDYIISRGPSTYQFDTKRETVTVSQTRVVDDQLAESGNFSRVLDNYRAIYDGTETVADRAATSIVLINRFTGERALRVWIDRETHLVLKKEEYHANGAVASQTRFEEVRYTGTIPDGIFSTDTPTGYAHLAGTTIAQPSANIDAVIKNAGFSPYRPKDLPQGFTVSSADVTTVNGVRTLHLIYTDGLRSISLFENAASAAADFGAIRPKTTHFEGHAAEYIEDGPTTLLTWKEHDLSFALVGDLLLPELVQIATSVVP